MIGAFLAGAAIFGLGVIIGASLVQGNVKRIMEQIEEGS